MVLQVGEGAAEPDALVLVGLVDVQAVVDRGADDLARRGDGALQPHLSQGIALPPAGLGLQHLAQLQRLGDDPLPRRSGPGRGAVEQLRDLIDLVAFDQANPVVVEAAELHAAPIRRQYMAIPAAGSLMWGAIAPPFLLALGQWPSPAVNAKSLPPPRRWSRSAGQGRAG